MSSNTINCECCQSVIDLDDTDWCDKCDRSIFDESPCKVSEKTSDYMYNWIREKSKIGEVGAPYPLRRSRPAQI